MIGHGSQHRSQLISFLAFVVILQFGYPITTYGRFWDALYSLAYIGMVLFGIALASNQRITRRGLTIIGAITLVVVAWFVTTPPDGALFGARPITLGIFQLVLLVPLSRYLLGDGPSDDRNDVLLIALNMYLVLGAMFGSAYQAIEVFAPGSFVDSQADVASPQALIYASYTTLTTLGFGDVVAVNSWARSLMTFEAVIGPLFVAIVITRLISSRSGRAVAHLISDEPEPTAHDRGSPRPTENDAS